jgi:hypothetical protein
MVAALRMKPSRDITNRPLTSRVGANGFSTAGLSVGQHTLWIGADNFGQTAEGDENNNWQSITFTVTASPQADLVLSDLNVWDDTVAQGRISASTLRS